MNELLNCDFSLLQARCALWWQHNGLQSTAGKKKSSQLILHTTHLVTEIASILFGRWRHRRDRKRK